MTPIHPSAPNEIERSRGESWTILGSCAVLITLMLLIISGALKGALPEGVAAKISFNSEGYLYAVILTPWIYYIARRPRARLHWLLGVALGAIGIAVGVALLNSSLPSAIKTLNEPAIALGVLIPYVLFRRPLRRTIVTATVVVLLLIILAGVGDALPSEGMPMGLTNPIINLAEGVALVLLTVLALDVIETWVLLPENPRPSSWARVAFYGMLVFTPVVVSALGDDVRAGREFVSLTLNFLGRVHESFVGVLILCACFLVADHLSPRHAGARPTR